MNPEALGEYRVVKRLGKGSYGEVSLAINSQGKKVALKKMMKEDMEDRTRENLEGEIKCMREMKSPHIVKIFNNFEDDFYYYLECEYCEGGDLFNYQAGKKGKKFQVDEAARIISDVIRGLQDLHAKKYLHRDIKSQNILIGKN